MKTLAMYRPNTIQNLFWNPDTLRGIDRYFDSFFSDSGFGCAVKPRIPAVDIRETETSYMLDIELPGCTEQEIEIHVDGSSLSIASKKEEVKETKEKDNPEKENWVLRERRVNAFSRSFKLPENANPEEVTAEFKNGVLGMEIKKKAEAQKRAIKIGS